MSTNDRVSCVDIACVQVNSPCQFLVDSDGVQGKPDAKVVAPSGTETEANVQQTQQGNYSPLYEYTCQSLTCTACHRDKSQRSADTAW